MGVIFFSILLGGFAQDNIGALLASENISSLSVKNGFGASVNGMLILNPYDHPVVLLKPSIAIRRANVALSLGYLWSPGSLINEPILTGVPFSLDASLTIPLLEKFFLKPRVSLLGPVTFFPQDPHYSYRLNLTGGGGIDAVYDPFKGKDSPIRLVGSIGATTGYAWGKFVRGIANYEEPLEGFGIAGNTSLSLLYGRDKWTAALQAKVSYGGKFVPEVSLSFLW